MPSRRKPSRLSGYDYTLPRAYFVTICSHNRRYIFGSVSEGVFIPNQIGQIVQTEWQRSEIIRLELIIDSWVLMPNHLHGIVWILADHNHVGATGRSPLRKDNNISGPPKKSLGSFIAGFKAASTSAIHQKVGPISHPIWQRNYYDHIIRNERDLEHHRRYILENPLSWELDQYFNTE